MMRVLAELQPVESTGYEIVFLAIGGLLTLALLVGFIVFLVRQRGR